LRATIAIGVAIVLGALGGLGGRVQAGVLGHQRPPVRLELGACLEHERDAIERAVRVEVGEDAPATDDASAVAVRVECAVNGLDAGIVLEVRQPDSPRRYRYALDWHAQPPDARPRLIGLAVAEAVDASRIELTAIPEPPPALDHGSISVPGPARTASDWTVALGGSQRTFSARGGVDLLGVGLSPARRLSTHLRLAADVQIEGTTVLTSSGAVAVLSVSAAPSLVYHVGGRLHGEASIGARVGIVRMHGEALPQSQLVGERLVRAWAGPAAAVALGTDLTPNLAVIVRFELGVIASGATARDLGQPAAALDGAWTSLGLAAVIAM
jgi:hypothetical protein